MTDAALYEKVEQIAQNVTFRDEEHEKFFLTYLSKCKYYDSYHGALMYCLGIDADTRQNIETIYDFMADCIKMECLHDGWITSGSAKVLRMAFNLYTGGTPSIYDYDDAEKRLTECEMYTVAGLFCCGYAKYFWQAVKIRYPEYCKEEERSESNG